MHLRFWKKAWPPPSGGSSGWADGGRLPAPGGGLNAGEIYTVSLRAYVGPDEETMAQMAA